MSDEKFVGFHGTTIECADKILETKEYKFSFKEEEWLGKGVYFFEKDKKQAINFCTKARKYKNYCVLKSELAPEIFLDLDDTETMEYMETIAKKLKGRYMKLKNGQPRKLINSVILETIYNTIPYDMVKKTFPVEKKNTIDRTNFEWVQIQMCVRNRKCICSIEEVERNEGN